MDPHSDIHASHLERVVARRLISTKTGLEVYVKKIHGTTRITHKVGLSDAHITYCCRVFLCSCRSRLIFGAASLGDVYGDLSQAEKNAAVEHAFAHGINTFDTSAFYGGGRSETYLGIALKALPRSQITVCTKAGRTASVSGSGSGGGFDFSASGVEECVKGSLQRLGLSSVDGLILHDIEFGPLSVIQEDALPYLEHLKATGICKAIGVSAYPHGLLKKVILDQFDSKHPLDYVISYNHCTIQNDTVGRLIQDIKHTDCAVLEASPLALGYLADGPTQAWLPLPKQMLRVKQSACELANIYGTRLSTIACEYHLQASNRRGVAASIMGAKTITEWNDVLEAYSHPSVTRQLLAQHIRDEFARLLHHGGRRDEEWNNHSGLPLHYEYEGHDGWVEDE